MWGGAWVSSLPEILPPGPEIKHDYFYSTQEFVQRLHQPANTNLTEKSSERQATDLKAIEARNPSVYFWIFVCSHRPKTFLFTIWFISSLKKFKWKKLSLTGNQTGVLQLHSQVLYPLSYSHIVTHVVKNYLFNLRMSKTMPQTLDQYWSTFVPLEISLGMFNSKMAAGLFWHYQFLYHKWILRV